MIWKSFTQKGSLDILYWNNWRQLRRNDDLFKVQEIILSTEISIKNMKNRCYILIITILIWP